MVIRKSKTVIDPLPYIWYAGPVLLLAISGLLDAIYLSFSHYRVYTDIGYSSFCAISQSLNCDTVSQSPLSILFNVPVPIWGVFGYTFFLALFGYSHFKLRDRQRTWALLFVVAFSFSIISVVLAYISTKYIRTLCIMCLLSYGINFALTFYCWMICRRYSSVGLFKNIEEDIRILWRNKKFSGALVSVSIFAAIILLLGFPSYWHMEPIQIDETLSRGITSNGHPWIGAVEPELTIEEYSDYQCFQCRKMHYYLRKLVAANRDRIRLVHRHFPMDHLFNPLVKEPFHPGSGNMALVAIYATEHGKFWEMNDMLLSLQKNQSIGVRKLFTDVGLDTELYFLPKMQQKIAAKLFQDIKTGLELEITGTPTYLINGELHVGKIEPDILNPYLSSDAG